MGCKKCNEQNDYNPCNPTPCQEPVECSCPTILKSDCVIYSGNDLECSGIPTGTILTELIEQQDAFICESLSNIPQTTLKNIGTGAKVYKGDDLLGRKELRTIKSTDSSITVSENTNEIDLSVDLLGNTPPCIVSTKGTVTISTTTEGCIDLDVTTYNGAETKVTAGANVTVSGIGTVSNPYIINSAISTLQDGITTDVIGNGTSTPYSVEVINLQKIISTFPYTLTSLDDKYTIFVSNDVSNVTINVPNSLVPNFSCVFIQEGSGEVTIQSTGTATVIQPIALENKIKGQNYWAMIEKKTTTDTYYLMGSLKTV